MMRALERCAVAVFFSLAVSACIGTTPPLPVGTLAAAPPVAPDAPDATAPGLPDRIQAANGRFAFAPLTGAPQPVADRLAASIAAASVQHNVPLAPFAQGNGAYVVKGYLSAVTEADTTRAIYVWDVLDGERARLNRITGSVAVPVTADNPWDVIGGATLDKVAAETVGALAAWQAANGT
ncbi:MAG: hypothetical protein OEL78_08000 [Hyphomicrobiales bacterium]|nr:hypothetical protein [Hyphomicrobiales bacterium]